MSYMCRLTLMHPTCMLICTYICTYMCVFYVDMYMYMHPGGSIKDTDRIYVRISYIRMYP